MTEDENKKMYDSLYTYKNYPLDFKEYLYPIFQKVAIEVKRRVDGSNIKNKFVNLSACLQYLCEEHFFNITLVNPELIEEIENSVEYQNALIYKTVDKIFFNEYLEYKSTATVTRYSPLISTLTFFLNFIINKYSQLPKPNDLNTALKLDILKKGFFMTKSVSMLLCDGFETEAFSTWRTIHEIECVVAILNQFPEVSETYYQHIQYNITYREGAKTMEEEDNFYAEVKEKLKQRGLKSKDFKKYLEYGWLYSLNDWENRFPEMKLNFRKGTEYVAGLSKYASIYEASSEIAHGSSLLIYSNKVFYRNITIVCLYETFIRLENIFYSIILQYKEVDSSAYQNMRNIYLKDVEINLTKLKIANDYLNKIHANNSPRKKHRLNEKENAQGE